MHYILELERCLYAWVECGARRRIGLGSIARVGNGALYLHKLQGGHCNYNDFGHHSVWSQVEARVI